MDQEKDGDDALRPDNTPAGIRTPEEFVEAIERYASIEAEPTMLEERERLAVLIENAPFTIAGDKVVAKGFRGSVAK